MKFCPIFALVEIPATALHPSVELCFLFSRFCQVRRNISRSSFAKTGLRFRVSFLHSRFPSSEMEHPAVSVSPFLFFCHRSGDSNRIFFYHFCFKTACNQPSLRKYLGSIGEYFTGPEFNNFSFQYVIIKIHKKNHIRTCKLGFFRLRDSFKVQ